jgi:hypothetical protein
MDEIEIFYSSDQKSKLSDKKKVDFTETETTILDDKESQVLEDKDVG